ncbi:MAG: hypothetical protein OEY01_01220 [Desulfobulbaceae bacterium]|nr:hypothetical protein [Desulfobulbaceae bacterium]HIJ77913.1 hypothetical protein [Deltaproteobacteria bacterium]
MKITIDKNVVEVMPENPGETHDLETLWRIMVDCLNDNKRLSPIGEFIPGKNKLARFVIEGVAGGVTQRVEQTAAADATYYCATCNKYMKVAKGEGLPTCCGKVMENMD